VFSKLAYLTLCRARQARGASGDEDEFSADVAGLADAISLGGAVEGRSAP
jgi:hypothetical protein